MRQSKVDLIKTKFGRMLPILSVMLLSGFLLNCPGTALAQFVWTGDASDLWNNAANWSSSGGPGFPNAPTATATITNTTFNPVLISGINPIVATLTLSGSGNGLTIDTNQSLTMDGSGGSTISNAGSILLNGGGGSSGILVLDVNTSLSGAGTFTLSTASGGGNAIIEQGVGGVSLTNSSTIQGNGIIGNGGLGLVNQSGGIVNANVSGSSAVAQRQRNQLQCRNTRSHRRRHPSNKRNHDQ